MNEKRLLFWLTDIADEYVLEAVERFRTVQRRPRRRLSRLLVLADRVREHFGAAAIVSSGLRCAVHNKNVGGASASRHMTGKAMDFRIRGKGSAAVMEFVREQPEVRYAYAIDGSYVHMDVV